MALVSLQEVRIAFDGPDLLDGVTLQIERGERVCLVGRNGAGKTTFLRILAGLSHPSSGKVTVNPESAAAPRYVRGCIGYLSHNTSLYSDMTALESRRGYMRRKW